MSDFPPLLRVLAELLREESIDDTKGMPTKRGKRELSITLFADRIKHLRSCNLCHCDIVNRYLHHFAIFIYILFISYFQFIYL